MDWTAIIVALISQAGLLLTVYLRLKGHIDKKTEETKQHSDLSVQKLNGLLTTVIHSFDAPAWIKIATNGPNNEIDFRMSEVNDKYTELFGIKRSEYIGKTDLEAGWPKELAEKFRQHDLLVWASGEPQTIEEDCGKGKLVFRKLRLESPDGKLKGVMGYQIKTVIKADKLCSKADPLLSAGAVEKQPEKSKLYSG